MNDATLHRVRMPRGASPSITVGTDVRPDQVLAHHRRPGAPRRVPLAGPLHADPEHVAGLLVATPGSMLTGGDVIARVEGGREVRAPIDGLLLGVAASDGSALLSPLGDEEPVIGHVSGTVTAIEDGAITIEVPGVLIRGVGGTGSAVHGELVVAVHDPEEELRAAAIDVGATGKIVVGGSRASAETLTRARAMGVAGIVLGGVLDKELRDFEAIQRRRREVGGLTGSFGVLLVEGFGKVGIDPQRFAWFRAHAGRMASLFGADGLLYVYDAQLAPGTPQPAAGGGAGDRPSAAVPGPGGRAGGRARGSACHAIGHPDPHGAGPLRGWPPGAGPDGEPGGHVAGAASLGCVSLPSWTDPASSPAAARRRRAPWGARSAASPRPGRCWP